MWLMGTMFSLLGYMLSSHFLSNNSTDIASRNNLSVYEARIQGELFHAYAEGVYNFALNNPTFNGTVPVDVIQASGFMPVGVVIPTGWTNEVSGNGNQSTMTVYVWAPPASIGGGTRNGWRAAAGALSKISGGSYLEGIDSNGTLVSALSVNADMIYGGTTSTIPLPNSIPQNSLVMAVIP